jgi:hypothetical protein
VDLQHVIAQVDDPVLGHAAAGVDAGLACAVEVQAAVCDLDDQERAARVMIYVVPWRSGYDGDVGLWLGGVVVPVCSLFSF